MSVAVGGVLQVSCPTRRGDQFAKHAAVGGEQQQQVRGGKIAPLLLPAGQTEMHPQLLSVGHGKTGAVDVPGAVAVPTQSPRIGLMSHRLLKLLGKHQQHRQGEALAGLTIGGPIRCSFPVVQVHSSSRRLPICVLCRAE